MVVHQKKKLRTGGGSAGRSCRGFPKFWLRKGGRGFFKDGIKSRKGIKGPAQGEKSTTLSHMVEKYGRRNFVGQKPSSVLSEDGLEQAEK